MSVLIVSPDHSGSDATSQEPAFQRPQACILVVEDDVTLATMLRLALEAEHYIVDVVRDGDEGWTYSQQHHYDVIILDIMLPKRDGLTLCQQLRAQRRRTPILLLSARDTIEDRVTGLDLGADDYLVKPFVLQELMARLRALLRRHQLPTFLQVADLRLDVIRHTVSRGGQPIEVTATEYALLELLVRHTGAVVTRAQIVEHVWGQRLETSSNVIDVYMAYLRRKIDRPCPVKLLHTIRGVGYTLRTGP